MFFKAESFLFFHEQCDIPVEQQETADAGQDAKEGHRADANVDETVTHAALRYCKWI